MKAIALVMMFGVCSCLCFYSDLFDPVGETHFEKAVIIARGAILLSLAVSFIFFWVDVLFFPALAR